MIMLAKLCLTSLGCLMVCGVLSPPACRAADLVSANEIRQTLSARQLSRHRTLFQRLNQLPKLDAEQSAALAEATRQLLAAKSPATLSALQGVYFLRRADGPETEDVVLEALRSSDPRVAILALDAIAILTPETAFSLLKEKSSGPVFAASYGFRRGLVDAVAAYQNAEAVGFLIELLPQIDGQLEFLTVRHLVRLSGRNFADDASQWTKWWLAEAGTYRGPPEIDPGQLPLDARQMALHGNRNLPEFYEVPLFAKKIVFLIDHSRSMLSTLDNVTRLETAQEELTEAISAMAEDVEFNVVAYNDRLEFWQPQLVPANSAAKADAARFAGMLSAFGKTAAYDALARGLEFDPNTELLVYLADGKPTVGTIVEPSAIIKAITEQNLFQRTTIDSLGIDTEGESEQFMRELSRKNDGTYYKIR
jgi:hypothetical protein